MFQLTTHKNGTLPNTKSTSKSVKWNNYFSGSSVSNGPTWKSDWMFRSRRWKRILYHDVNWLRVKAKCSSRPSRPRRICHYSRNEIAWVRLRLKESCQPRGSRKLGNGLYKRSVAAYCSQPLRHNSCRAKWKRNTCFKAWIGSLTRLCRRPWSCCHQGLISLYSWLKKEKVKWSN